MTAKGVVTQMTEEDDDEDDDDGELTFEHGSKTFSKVAHTRSRE